MRLATILLLSSAVVASRELIELQACGCDCSQLDENTADACAGCCGEKEPAKKNQQPPGMKAAAVLEKAMAKQEKKKEKKAKENKVLKELDHLSKIQDKIADKHEQEHMIKKEEKMVSKEKSKMAKKADASKAKKAEAKEVKKLTADFDKVKKEVEGKDAKDENTKATDKVEKAAEKTDAKKAPKTDKKAKADGAKAAAIAKTAIKKAEASASKEVKKAEVKETATAAKVEAKADAAKKVVKTLGAPPSAAKLELSDSNETNSTKTLIQNPNVDKAIDKAQASLDKTIVKETNAVTEEVKKETLIIGATKELKEAKKELDVAKDAKKEAEVKAAKGPSYSQSELDRRVNVAATHAATEAVTLFKQEANKGKKEIKQLDSKLKKAAGTLKKDDSGVKTEVAIKTAALKAETKKLDKNHIVESKIKIDKVDNSIVGAMKTLTKNPSRHGLNENAAAGIEIARAALERPVSFGALAQIHVKGLTTNGFLDDIDDVQLLRTKEQMS